MEKLHITWILWKKCYLLARLLLCLSLLILHAGGLQNERYMGCFNYIDRTALVTENSDSFSSDHHLTVELCTARCLTQNATYSALQNKAICRCVDEVGIQLPDDACNVMCNGSELQFCGGTAIGGIKSSNHVVSVVYAVCPVGNYGSACDKFCHCKRQIPCDRMTGNCSDGCDGNYKGSSCDETSLREQYIGCYKDVVKNRALSIIPYAFSRRNTLQMCKTSCAAASSSYAGTQWTGECYCGESYARYGRLRESSCNMTCAGNRSEMCGGPDALSVYSVCPAGNYGTSCAGRCHCLNDQSCIYRNGSCPSSQCKPGWTGASCNIRDCTTNNGDCNVNETCSVINLNYSNVSACRCPNGFQRNKIWEFCTDIDECSITVCDPDSMTCTNTIGGYSCFCKGGFQAHNNTACIDIDECQQNMHACDYSTTDCYNTPGSFRCSSKQRFYPEESTIVAGAIGFAIGGLLFLLVALSFFQICRKYCKVKNEHKFSESTSSEGRGDASGPSKMRQSNKDTAPFENKSTGYVDIAAESRGYLCRPTQDDLMMNAPSEIVAYEIFNRDQFEYVETGVYDELKLQG